MEAGALYAGETVARINDIRAAGALTRELARPDRRPRHAAITHQLGKDYGVVVLLVASGIDGSLPAPCARGGAVPRFAPPVDFNLAAVARAKLGEAFGNVVKPFAQLITRCQLSRPLVQPGALVGDAARPNMIDEHAVAVVRLGRVVDTLGAHVDGHRRGLGLMPPQPGPTLRLVASPESGRVRRRDRLAGLFMSTALRHEPVELRTPHPTEVHTGSGPRRTARVQDLHARHRRAGCRIRIRFEAMGEAGLEPA